jgi:hypothetical protein
MSSAKALRASVTLPRAAEAARHQLRLHLHIQQQAQAKMKFEIRQQSRAAASQDVLAQRQSLKAVQSNSKEHLQW